MSAILEREGNNSTAGLRLRQRQARDEAILQAALELIEERGYEAMTMDDLANRLEISKRTLYHHFPSKEAIAAAAMTRRVRDTTRHVREDSPGLPAINRLENVLRWLVGRRLAPQHGAADEIRAHPELMAAIRTNPEYCAAADSLVAAVAAIAQDAQREGSTSTHIPPAVAAHLLLGLVRGTHWAQAAYPYAAAITRLIDTVVATYLSGIRADRLGE